MSIPVDKEGSRVRNKMAFFLDAVFVAKWRQMQVILMIDRSMCTDIKYYSLNYMSAVCLYVAQRCCMIDKRSVDMFGADRKDTGWGGDVIINYPELKRSRHNRRSPSVSVMMILS
jgi:hypothetical protein